MNHDNFCFVDTNVWIGLLLDSSVHHKKALSIAGTVSRLSLIPSISPIILSETLHVFKSIVRLENAKNVFSESETMIRTLFTISNLVVLPDPNLEGDYLKVVALMKAFGLSVNDALILYTLQSREFGYLSTLDEKLANAAERFGVRMLN